eukprot:scaffold12.g7907.t1
MKQIIAISSPIHVSTTGPVYLLSPTGGSVAVRRMHGRAAWASRRMQTLLLAALALVSLAVLVRGVGPTPAAPREVLTPAGHALAAAALQQPPAAQQQQQAPPSPQQQQPVVQAAQQRHARREQWQEAQQADTDFPLHVCCLGERCLAGDKGRYAVVTYVRNERQLEQARRLARSLWAASPGVHLAVMMVRGELVPEAAAVAAAELNATLYFVEPVAAGRGRGWAWLKGAPASWVRLRAFGLTQYDAVLVVEPEAVVHGKLGPLFRLPTDFAIVASGGGAGRTQQQQQQQQQQQGGQPKAAAAGGGQAPTALPHEAAMAALSVPALFLRPCAPAEAHLVSVLGAARRQSARGERRGGGDGAAAAGLPGLSARLLSEPDFLGWYFGPGPAALRLPFGVYVINLDGAADRLAWFRRTYAASDLGSKPAARWPAVDGASLDLPAVVSAKALEQIEAAQRLGYRTKHYQLTRGSVGCYLSHVQLWRALLGAPEQHALIFEDDAVIEPSLVSRLAAARPFPSDWDVMLLGYYCYRCSPLLGDRRYIWVEGFFGTHAYLVHKRALRKVFAYPRLWPVELQIDALMSEMAQAGLLNVYALNEHPMLVDQNNKDFHTSAQLPVKRGLWNDPWAHEDERR